MSSDVTVNLRVTGEDKLVGGLNRSAAAVKQLGRSGDALNEFKGSLSEIPSMVNAVEAAFDNLKSSFVELGALLSVAKLAESLVDAQVHIQQIHYTLQAATGSAQGAADAFDYIARASDRLGLSLETTSDGYGKFLISAKAANVEIADTKALFEAVSNAATVFHLSNTKLQQAMRGIETSMAIGAFTGRTLRLEIGAALPGAYEYFVNKVKERGIDIHEAFHNGTLDVKEYTKVLTEAVNQTFTQNDVREAAQGLNAQLNRMKNAVFLFKAQLSGGLFEEAAAASLKQVASLVEGTTEISKSFGPLAATVTVGAAVFYAYSKAMNAVGNVSKNFIISSKERIRAVLDENKVAHESAIAETGRRAALVTSTLAAKESAIEEARIAELRAKNKQDRLAEAQAALVKAAADTTSARAARNLSIAERDVVNAERAANNATKDLGNSRRALAAADTAATVAEAELAAALTVERAAAARAAQGLVTQQGILNGIAGAAKGIFGILGGWPTVIFAAVIGAKELYDWFNKSAKEAEEVAKQLNAVERKQNDPKLAISEKISATEEGLQILEKQRAELAQSVADAEALRNTFRASRDDLSVSANLLDLIDATVLGIADAADSKLKTEKELSRENERRIDQEREKLKLEKEQAEFLHQVVDQLSSVDDLYNEFSKKNIDKEILKLQNDTKRRDAKYTDRVDTANVERMAEAQQKLAAAENEYLQANAKVASAGKLFTDDDVKKLDEATKKLDEARGGIQRLNEEEQRNATSKINEKARKDYAEYLQHRINLEKKLDADNEKRERDELKAEIDKKSIREGEKIFLKEKLLIEERLKAELEDINKLETDRNNNNFGKPILSAEEIDRRTRHANAVAAAQVQSADEKSFIDGAIAQTKQLKAVAEAQAALTKVASEYDKQLQAGTLTDTEVIAKQEELGNAYKKVLQEIFKLDEHTQKEILDGVNLKSKNKELAASYFELAASMRAKQKALGEQNLQSYQLGLAAQAGSTQSADILALQSFRKQTEQALLSAKVGRDTEEWQIQMDQALTYFDRIQAKAKGLTTVYEDLASAAAGFFDQLLSTDWVEKAQEGSKAVLKAFTDMILGMLKEILRTQIMKYVNKLVDLVGDAITKVPGGVGGAKGTITSAGGGAYTSGGNFAYSLPLAEGGYVSGPGGPKDDKIPSWLSNGEFVMNAGAVQRYGVDFLNALNDSKGSVGRSSRYANGGLVASGTWSPPEQKVNVINATGQPTRTERGKGANGEDVVNVIMGRVADSVARNGIVGQSIKQAFGAQRVGKK